MNNFCTLLGIRHPVILGGMARIGTAPLAAAVSNAGGLGLLGSSVWTPHQLREQIEACRKLTQKVFGVNIPVRAKCSADLAAVVMEEKIPVVVTSAGDPRVFTKRLQDEDIFVMHVSSTVDLAVKARRAGVNAVIAEGSESGGLTGLDGIATFVLVPQVVDAVDVPVVAAGGIGDGRGLAAALALGASAVQMGTVFISAEECEVSRAFKELLIMARETDAVLVERDRRYARVLREDFVRQALAEISARDPGAAEKMNAGREEDTRAAGQVAGLIRSIRPAAKIIDDMIREARLSMDRIAGNMPD